MGKRSEWGSGNKREWGSGHRSEWGCGSRRREWAGTWPGENGQGVSGQGLKKSSLKGQEYGQNTQMRSLPWTSMDKERDHHVFKLRGCRHGGKSALVLQGRVNLYSILPVFGCTWVAQ